MERLADVLDEKVSICELEGLMAELGTVPSDSNRNE